MSDNDLRQLKKKISLDHRANAASILKALAYAVSEELQNDTKIQPKIETMRTSGNTLSVRITHTSKDAAVINTYNRLKARLADKGQTLAMLKSQGID